MEPQPLIEETTNHNDVTYTSKFYLGDPSKLPRIDQPQAVCFVSHGNQYDVVFYRHIKGFLGCPGGGVESGEITQQALAREILEEINAQPSILMAMLMAWCIPLTTRIDCFITDAIGLRSS